jgi:6-phosphogluconolactonase (cycloisomerase 2 family)
MVATPATQWVFVSDWIARTITAYKADPSSGALTKAGVTSLPNSQQAGLMMDPLGRFVFVSDQFSRTITTFTINSDGTLTQTSTASGFVSSFGFDVNGKFLYTANDNQITGYAIASNGALTPVPGSPVTARSPINNPDKGPTGLGIAVDPQAHFVFAPDFQSNNIWVYSIGSDGSLTPVSGSPFALGGLGGVATVDPTGRFLYVTGGPTVGAFKIGSDGSLTPVAGSPFDNGPFRAGGAPVFQAITDPQGKFLLLADTENSEITVFSIDQSTGALTNVSGSPFKVPGYPIGGGAPTAIAMTH